jgi:hypothetical protein
MIVKSLDVEALIQEVKAAITAADGTAEAQRVKALDPVASPDPARARAAMEDAAFTRDCPPHGAPEATGAAETGPGGRIRRALGKVESYHDPLAAELRAVYSVAGGPTCWSLSQHGGV